MCFRKHNVYSNIVLRDLGIHTTPPLTSLSNAIAFTLNGTQRSNSELKLISERMRLKIGSKYHFKRKVKRRTIRSRLIFSDFKAFMKLR